MKIRFLKEINVEHRAFTTGQIVDAAELDPGAVESMLNVKAAEKIEDPRQPEAFRPKDQNQPQQPKK